jgi:hypothetical protein
MALSMADWIIVAVYLTVIVGIGVSMRLLHYEFKREITDLIKR